MRRAALGAIASLLLAGGVSPVAGHGDSILELGAERVQPGGTIEVRGDLGTGETFEVALVSTGDGSRRSIATIPASDEGHFQGFVTVPADVTDGDYLVEVSADHVEVRAPLTVAGPAIAPAGGEEPEQEEGLLQPFPSVVRAGNGMAGPRSSDPTASRPLLATSISIERSPIEGVVIVVVAIAIAVALFAVIRAAGGRWRQRSNPARSTDDG